jgi:hypothetical protein
MSDTMNGGEAGQQPLGKDQLDAIKELEEILADARAGKIASFGMIVVHGPGNLNLRGTMSYMLELYFGCDGLKDMLKAIMLQRAQQQAQGRQSRILRPGNLPPGGVGTPGVW